MLLRIIYYFTLIILVSGSPQVFSSPACENDGFSGSRSSQSHYQKVNSLTLGVESYGQLLVRLAQSSLRVRKLSPEQIRALETYHKVVQGEEGADGTFARVGNYTLSQRGKIIRFLQEVFSPKQVTTLIEDGVVEISRLSDIKITRRVLKHFKKGKKIFIQLYGSIYRLSEVLEEMESGFLVEVGFVAPNGYIYGQHLFLITNSDIKASSIEVNPSQMIKISEKTRNGFVIDTLIERKGESGEIDVIEGNKVFFSFERAWRAKLLPQRPRAQDRREMEAMLKAYIAETQGQIPSEKDPSYRMVNGTMIGNGKEYPDFESSVKKSLIGGTHEYSLANPESKAIFVAAESDRKRIHSRYLKLPAPPDTEARLAEQGYKDNYKSGVDKVDEWVAVRTQLQKMKANPWTTHIDYFANQIPVHVAHIRKGLENNYSPRENWHGSRLEQLRRLEDLEKEAQQVASERKVTYEWWLEFNFQLAYIMSGLPAKFRDNNADVGSVKLNMVFFPTVVVMPDIQTEKGLGIMAFNRAGLKGVYPAGLINQTSVNVHNELPAYDFFSHDVYHAFFRGGNQIYREYSVGHQLFHKRLLDNIENLPPEQRKKAEEIYFLMTHEFGEGINISYSDWTPQKMREEVVGRIIKDIPKLFNFSKDPSAAEMVTINNFADIFMAVYTQALQHQ